MEERSPQEMSRNKNCSLEILLSSSSTAVVGGDGLLPWKGISFEEMCLESAAWPKCVHMHEFTVFRISTTENVLFSLLNVLYHPPNPGMSHVLPTTNALRFSNPKTDSKSGQPFGREWLLGILYTQLCDIHPPAKHWLGGLLEGKQLLENAFVVVVFTPLLSTKNVFV